MRFQPSCCHVGTFCLIVDQLTSSKDNSVDRGRQIWFHGTGDRQLLFRFDAFRSRR